MFSFIRTALLLAFWNHRLRHWLYTPYGYIEDARNGHSGRLYYGNPGHTSTAQAPRSRRYDRFVAVTAILTVAMYGLMWLNSSALDHAFFSQARMPIALAVSGAMAAAMLTSMLCTYFNLGVDAPIFPGSHPSKQDAFAEARRAETQK